MKIKYKILVINIVMIVLVLLLHKNITYYLQYNMVIFSVAIVCSFLYSIFVFIDDNSNKLAYLAPIISLILGYYMFWVESSFIRFDQLIIGIVIGVILYFTEMLIVKKISYK